MPLTLPDLLYIADPALLAVDLELELDDWQRSVLGGDHDSILR
jgi:hypothetical protein